MNCGKQIRKARLSAGLTQKELAQKLGVSAALVGQYETGIRNPKIDTLSRIADALSLSLSFFQGTQPFSDMEFLSEYKIPILCKLVERGRLMVPDDQLKDISDYEYWKYLSSNVVSIIRLDLNLLNIQFLPNEDDESEDSFDVVQTKTASISLNYKELLHNLTIKRNLALETYFILQDLTMLDDQCVKKIQQQVKQMVLDPSNIYIE